MNRRKVNLSAFFHLIALSALFVGTPLTALSDMPKIPAEQRLSALSGTVKDTIGLPLVGAVVSVLSGQDFRQVTTTSQTDARGWFQIPDLPPGLYCLKISATGFQPLLGKPIEIGTNHQPESNFVLQRAATVLKSQSIDPVKYQSRRNRTVFQLDDDENPDVLLAQEIHFQPQFHGSTTLMSQSSGLTALGAPSVSLNSQLTHQFSESVFLETSLQTNGAAASVDQFSFQVRSFLQGHAPTISAGYTRLRTTNGTDSMSTIGKFTVRATDTWQIGDKVLLIYGVDYAQLSQAQDTTIQPYIGLRWALTPHTQLFGAVSHEGDLSFDATPHLEDRSTPFQSIAEPQLAVTTSTPDDLPRMQLDRTRRYEAGLAHQLTSRSTIETTLFLDTVSGHGIGLALLEPNSVLTDRVRQTPLIIGQNGVQHGVRLWYRRRLTPTVSVAAGYAAGYAQKLALTSATEIDPRATSKIEFQPSRFQVLTARIDAHILQTGATITAVVRKTLGNPVFAVDPFQGRLPALDRGISIFVSQPIPLPQLIPGRWEILIEGRNLFDQTEDLSAEGMTIQWLSTRRTLRGGLGLRF
ncbi:MAG TPA: TonB-dependent receptor [Acidobacteriota bacterium]|nr:TonB-dependent receptor [Acidobacteriota bacterium]